MLRVQSLIAGQYLGTATNDNATAGNIGEFVSATVAAGSAITCTTSVSQNITSIVLTAGDWDVTGTASFTYGATTSMTNQAASISSTSVTMGAQGSGFDFESPAIVPTATSDATWVLPTTRFSLSAASTTIYLVTRNSFTVSTMLAYGLLRARRIR